MTLSRLPAGKRIFIDSNIFIYHFLGMHASCSRLLERTEAKEITGFSSVIVLSETWHRLLAAEAIEKYGLAPRKTVSFLKSHPGCIRELSRAREAVASLFRMNITIWELTRKTFTLAQNISQDFGLLANDSLNLALIRQHRLRDIATNDADFIRIKEIRVWRI